MKKNFLFILCLIITSTAAFANQEKDGNYLKIQLEDHKEISYPPGIGFVLQDMEGNTILSPSQLEELGTYKIEQPVTLFVFTTWSEEPDVYEIEKGTLLIGKSSYPYDPNTKYTYGRTKRGETYGKADKNKDYGKWDIESNGLRLINERYFDYDEVNGFDASLEFSNGLIFYYKDGEVSAWQNGKDLKIRGKYLIDTREGILKLSYNPKDKKIWWVFEKNN